MLERWQVIVSGDGYITGHQAGLSGDEQTRIALEAMIRNGGQATMQEIYQAVEARLEGLRLSEQGQASLRRLINTNAVRANLIYPHEKGADSWRITPEGREFLPASGQRVEPEEVINTETQRVEWVAPNAVRGAAFEVYVDGLLKKLYPRYTWYDQGRFKRHERGLDFIGSRVGEFADDPRLIGVQAKLHAEKNAPTELEWLKFLSGCFARRVDLALFITSGRLTAEQHREAGEARVVVVAGRAEITRIADQVGLTRFDLFDEELAS